MVWISFVIIKPRPNFVFVKAHFREIISYGKWITGSTIANYFYQHGDDIERGDADDGNEDRACSTHERG